MISFIRTCGTSLPWPSRPTINLLTIRSQTFAVNDSTDRCQLECFVSYAIHNRYIIRIIQDQRMHIFIQQCRLLRLPLNHGEYRSFFVEQLLNGWRNAENKIKGINERKIKEKLFHRENKSGELSLVGLAFEYGSTFTSVIGVSKTYGLRPNLSRSTSAVRDIRDRPRPSRLESSGSICLSVRRWMDTFVHCIAKLRLPGHKLLMQPDLGPV